VTTTVTCRADAADGCGADTDGTATASAELTSPESAVPGTAARLGSGDWLSVASAAVLPDVAVFRPDREAEGASERSEVSGRVVRAPERDDDFVPLDDDVVDASEPPAEPADPVLSANAAGIDTTAAPTPRATASAPTRPT
jgi:hypothetical protein